MKRPQLCLAALFACTTIHPVLAGNCPDGTPGTTIFYLNGILATRFDAEVALTRLENNFRNTIANSPKRGECLVFLPAYNETNGLRSDFWQSVRMRLSQDRAAFTRFLADVDSSPDWFQAEFAARSSAIDLTAGAPEINSQVTDVEAELSALDTAIVVAHSQGNLYANAIYKRLLDRGWPLPDVRRFSIVAVASPASITEGGGPCTTLTFDLVIRAVPLTICGTITNLPQNSDGHNFVGYYLNEGLRFPGPAVPSRSLTRIMNQILDLVPMRTSNVAPAAGFTMGVGLQTAVDGQTLNLTVAPGGTANVSVDASTRSNDVLPGFVTAYQWTVDGTVQSGVISSFRQFPLGVGSHSIQLVVRDNEGAQSAAVTGTVSVTATSTGPLYTITDLGLLPGGTNSRARGLNSIGTVVGSGESTSGADYNGCGSPRTDKPFVWTSSSGIQVIGPPPPHDIFPSLTACSGIALALNDQGTIVGGLDYGFAGRSRSFIWTTQDGMRILPGGVGSANDINNLGQAVGSAGAGAVRWTAAGVPESIALPAQVSAAYAINGVGTASGSSGIEACNTRPVIWDASGQPQTLDIDTLATTLPPRRFICSGRAWGINDSSTAVGSFFVEFMTGETGVFAFKGTLAGGVQSLGQLPISGTRTEAFGINNSGQIVGESNGHAFLWTDGPGMRDLNTLTGASGSTWELLTASTINENGQIIGQGINNGQAKAFLLTPVP